MLSIRQYQSDQLDHIVHRILQCAAIEKLYLHGIRFQQQNSLSVFTGRSSQQHRVLQYHFLALLEQGQEYITSATQDKIENGCRAITSVSACVLGMKQFNEWLSSGYSFAHQIFHNALLCHDAGTIPFASPGRYHQPGSHELKLWRDRAKHFFAGAEQYISQKQYALAAFMLHQCTEQSLIALIMAATGFRAPWHKMERLINMALPLSEGLDEIFPRDTEKEEGLFRLLQNAYTQPRYRHDYEISATEILTLADRVRRVMELTKPVKKEGMIELVLVSPERMSILG